MEHVLQIDSFWFGITMLSMHIQIYGISDNKIYHYHLNLRGSVSTRRLTRLPSIPKNDAKFSSLHSYRIYIQ
ncbi:hypothetical protein E1A91_A02G075700v1 [Gossypium mustelinum]|uniref:Uncharacterized protein n=1 Tax=Gossypium mustelinum TaxID=34275 RepID=A0A5D3A4C2_GOSMU|nr:hypothetical protein E1A91_A02G075700v1 [Gossypium mustelinum]